MQTCGKKIFSCLTACVAALVVSLAGVTRYYACRLPDHYYTAAGQTLSVAAALPVTAVRAAPQAAQLRLFGMIPVKQVSLTEIGETEVFLGGQPFGLKMLTAGIMVVSFCDVQTADGSYSPAEKAGLKAGDVIQAVGGVRIGSTADFQEAIAASGGEPVAVTLRRGDDLYTLAVQPAYSQKTGKWQAGMWVRGSTAGIGTVSYYTAGEDCPGFAGLGHAVCDADTGEPVPLGRGEVLAVSVTDVIAGSAGKPGELRGLFDTREPIGRLDANTPAGVFGTVYALPAGAESIPVGFRQDIRCGPALIYTTLEGSTPRAYSAEIEEILPAGSPVRNLVIRVTDPELLARTGGIVQGMSGSPIVQEGRLIGAVTHVFVRDPARGYGIFIENMLTAGT